MKFNKISLLFFAILALSLSSCKDYFGDVNVNPDLTTNVSPKTLLPTIEARIAYVYGGDASRYSSIMTQHIDGNNRQFAAYQGYSFVPDDFSTMWANTYSGVLSDIQELKRTSDANSYNTFSGIARALEAFTLLMATDVWGDIPYSNAFKGVDNLQPSYDTQEQIYATVFSLITEAKAKLTATSAGIVKPGTDDVIYGGSAPKWVKFCNVLEARAHLHLGKVDAANYGKALNSLGGGFASSADDARFAFVADEVGAAPWYQYNTQRGDAEVGINYDTILAQLNDPRRPILGASLYSDPAPLFTIDQKVGLLTYTEQKFIQAECLSKTGLNVTTAYADAIGASFAELGLTAAQLATYVAQPTVTPASVTLKEIMTQKYLALYTNPEVWTDWRRTGFPALVPNAGNTIPRRFFYSQNELDLNKKTPTGNTYGLYGRVWWDK